MGDEVQVHQYNRLQLTTQHNACPQIQSYIHIRGYYDTYKCGKSYLVLNALFAQALLILSLQVGINLSTLGWGVAVELGLETKYEYEVF